MVNLDQLEKTARKEKIPLMKDDGMDFLLEYIQEHPFIMKIFEAGTAVGWSAMKMAQVRENITIDTCEIDEERYKEARENIHKAGLDDRIFCHHCDVMDYHSSQYYDLFFIDAAKSQYQRYVRVLFEMSYTGSVFIFDNLNFHGIVEDPSLSQNRSTLQMTRKIAKFRDWIKNNKNFETEFHLDRGDGIAVSRRIL